MNILNATFVPVKMRWDTFTFPVSEGTPVSAAGVLANDSAAVGIITHKVDSKPLMDNMLVLIGGDVDLESFAYSLSDDAKEVLNGIRFFKNGAVEEPSKYTLPKASSSKLGGVKIGSNVNVTADGTISVSDASADTKGLVKMAANVSAGTEDFISKETFEALLTALINAGIMAAEE